MRVADERGRAAAEIAELGARRVRVDPDGATDRVLDPAQVVEAVVTGREVVEARDAREADLVERLRERSERARDVLILETHPRDAARSIGGIPGARRGSLEAARVAPPGERIGVIVEVVGAEAEEQLRLVVDADRDDRSFGREVRCDDRGDRRVPGVHAALEGRARIRRDGPRAGRRRHPRRSSVRRTRETRWIREHVIRDPEARQLCVDVRARAQHDGEASGARGGEKRAEVLAAGPVVDAVGGLVDAPRNIGLDDRQALIVDRAQTRGPALRIDAPVVHRSGVERQAPVRTAGRRDRQTVGVEPGAATCFHVRSSRMKRLGPRAHAGR